MVCTFFGHRDCSYTIKPAIEIKIIELVKNGVNCFYVGTKGNFDYLVINALIETKIRFPEIDINMPSKSGTLHGLKCPFRPELQAVRSKYDNIPSLTPLVQNKNFYFKLPRSR